jgi:hypothetical protein
MSQTDKHNDTLPVLIGAFALGIVVLLLAGCANNADSTYTPPSSSVDRSSPEHRYAKERVKLEGYSDKESQQAADAIIKFHNAQKNR